jgi:uncharacterized protein
VPVVANAGPLIALGRIGELHVLCMVYQHIIVPPAVYHEVTHDTTRPGARDVLEASWIHIEQVTDTTAVQQLRDWLDVGESEAIVLAQMKQLPLLIDERRGRTCYFSWCRVYRNGWRIVGS